MSDENENGFEFVIRPLERKDREWVAHFLDTHWSTTQIVSRGNSVYGHLLPGFIAEYTNDEDEIESIGLLTYNTDGDNCEVTTINSVHEGKGVGTALVNAMVDAAKSNKLKRLWMITTNDNLNALRFFQKRGFQLTTIHRNAIEVSRRIKPQIPITGMHGIPVRDEVELEYPL